MWEAAAIILIVAGGFFWIDSLRARERALAAGRRACERYGVQLLDETVQFARLRLARDEAGRPAPRRPYSFEVFPNRTHPPPRPPGLPDPPRPGPHTRT